MPRQAPPAGQPGRANIGGWSSFVADPHVDEPRVLHERGNPVHRVRVEHNRRLLLIHLSDEDGHAWTVIAVDRQTRRCAIAHAPQQREAARQAATQLAADNQSTG